MPTLVVASEAADSCYLMKLVNNKKVKYVIKKTYFINVNIFKLINF